MISKVFLFVCEKANYPELFKTGGKKENEQQNNQKELVSERF